MNDSTLFNELEQKIVGLVNALKAEREKNEKNTGSIIESQKLSKIEEHVTNMINILIYFIKYVYHICNMLFNLRKLLRLNYPTGILLAFFSFSL